MKRCLVLEGARPCRLSEGSLTLPKAAGALAWRTVALRVDNRVYLGSAHGDRVVSFDLPADP